MSYAREGRERTASPLLVDAVSCLGPSNGMALDIGAGSLSSSRHLLACGFAVDAVDPDPYTSELAAELDDPRLSPHCTDIQNFGIEPGKYGLVVAIHVLHLIAPDELRALVPRIASGLTDGGLLCVTLLGVRDAWAPTPWRATVLSRNELSDLIAGLEVVRMTELEYDGVDVLGRPKHWHTFRCLVRKQCSARRPAGWSPTW